MSRLIGLYSTLPQDQQARLLEAMLARSRSDPGWASARVNSGPVSMGWTGWRSPNLAQGREVVAVVDGCFYNRPALDPGAESDAALLVSLYLANGFLGALEKVNGDFAAALYDSAAATLWLARDRFGVKPLYYVSDAQGFFFASRPAALLTLPQVSGEVNRRFVALFAASHYRYFDNLPEESPYDRIRQLPAAHFLKITPSGLTPGRYWSLADQPDFADPEEDLARRYRELLLDAVSLRVKAAPRPAFTLSGGMDSSSVLACAHQMTGEKQVAFSTVYEDKTYDESAEIRAMLDTQVARWQPVKVGTPKVFELVGRMVRLHDEPVATATWLSHFLLCNEVARQGFGALFGGLGGDELNAGEYEYFLFHFADLRLSGQEDLLQREVKFWVQYHDHPIYRKSPEVMEQGLLRLVDLNHPGRCLPDRARLGRYAAALNREYFDLAAFEPVMDQPFKSFLKNRTFQDIFRETAPCCLRAEDRQTTALGLDHFLPFFDHRLVEFMFQVPGALKIQNGVTKHLLRLAMRGLLPEETRTRIKKTGWNAPAHLWFSGPGLELLLDLVHSRPFKERGIYEVREVERLIDEHHDLVTSGAPRDNHMMFLWQLVNLELWFRSLRELPQG